MTQDELDALPEDGLIGYTTEIINGVTVRIPRVHTVGALWTHETEPTSVIDLSGQRWMIGWAQGVRYKRRLAP